MADKAVQRRTLLQSSLAAAVAVGAAAPLASHAQATVTFLQALGSGYAVDQALALVNVAPETFHAEWRRRLGVRS